MTEGDKLVLGNETLGALLAIAKEKGVNPKELAKKIGTNHDLVYKLIGNKACNPGLRTTNDILAYFGKEAIIVDKNTSEK